MELYHRLKALFVFTYMKPTIEDCEADIKTSEQEIHYLNQVIDGIQGFISADSRESRVALRYDIYKYENLLQDCKRIKAKIETYRDELISKKNESNEPTTHHNNPADKMD